MKILTIPLAALALFLLGSLSSGATSLQKQDADVSPYGSCTGNVTGATLTCTPVGCPGGCYNRSVKTAFGEAKVCACDYIGPDPSCCTIAHLGFGATTTWGYCSSGGCPDGSFCSSWPEPDGGKTAFCFPF